MKIKDPLLLSMFSGSIAAIAANLFLYTINYFLPGDNINMPELTAEIFLKVVPENIDIITRTLGFIWSMIVGGIYSIVYIITLYITEWNWFTTKAILVILGEWLVGAGTVMSLLTIGFYTRDEPASIAAFFIAHIFFAIILSLLVKRFGEKFTT